MLAILLLIARLSEDYCGAVKPSQRPPLNNIICLYGTLQMIRSDVDIFCLQEVWEVRTQRRIRSALRDVYPYALSAIDLDTETDGDELACDSDDLDAVFTCRNQSCPGLTGPELAFCGSLRSGSHSKNYECPNSLCSVFL